MLQAKRESGALQCRPWSHGDPARRSREGPSPKKPRLHHAVPGLRRAPGQHVLWAGRGPSGLQPCLAPREQVGSRAGNKEQRPQERSERPPRGWQSAHAENG